MRGGVVSQKKKITQSSGIMQVFGQLHTLGEEGRGLTGSSVVLQTCRENTSFSFLQHSYDFMCWWQGVMCKYLSRCDEKEEQKCYTSSWWSLHCSLVYTRPQFYYCDAPLESFLLQVSSKKTVYGMEGTAVVTPYNNFKFLHIYIVTHRGIDEPPDS